MNEESWPQGPAVADLEEEQVVSVGVVEVNTIINENEAVEDFYVLQALVSKTNSFDRIIRLVRALRRFGERTLNRMA